MRRLPLIAALLLAGCAAPSPRSEAVRVTASAAAATPVPAPVASQLRPGVGAPCTDGPVAAPIGPRPAPSTAAPAGRAPSGTGPAGRSSSAPDPAGSPGRASSATDAAGSRARASVVVTGKPGPEPSASWDINDAQERARRVLESQHQPTPRRGTVPETAVPGAEACVYALRLEFSLLMAGSTQPPDAGSLERALHSAGLTRIVMQPGPSFGASTGTACVYGSFTATGPTFEIGPPAATCA